MVSMPSESGVTSSSNLSSTVAGEDAGLHGRAQRDHFIGIQFGVRLRAEQLFDGVAHQRDARRSAHQDHFIDLLDRDAGVRDAVRGTAPACGSRSA